MPMFSVVRVPNALPPHIMMTIFRHCPFPSFLPQKMKDPSGCFKSERFGSKVATYLVLLKAALIWWWTAAKCSPSQNTSFRCVVLFSNILTVFNKKKLSNTEFWPSNILHKHTYILDIPCILFRPLHYLSNITYK